MSDHIHNSNGPSLAGGDPTRTFNYPYASAPDIIRSNQKDAYFQSELLKQLSAVIRSLYGTRTEHAYSNEASVFTELLYLSLTTLLGNRTLGEEYCDIVQIEDDTNRLPSLLRRSGYIISTVLLPYFLTRLLPTLRRKLRAKLEVKLRKAHHRRVSSSQTNILEPTTTNNNNKKLDPPTKSAQLQEYILKHLDSLTSPAPIYALSLAVFYFTGAYYHLSKRLFGLRYIFTRKLVESDQRAGYEVLGVLLVVQMAVQTYLHLRDTYQQSQSPDPTNPFATPLLFEANNTHGQDPEVIKQRISHTTHTPLIPSGQHRYDLKDAEPMQWIDGKQARKCTLCLEAMRDPSATTCGHVFCWTCVTDWLREQPMCPLCRESCSPFKIKKQKRKADVHRPNRTPSTCSSLTRIGHSYSVSAHNLN